MATVAHISEVLEEAPPPKTHEEFWEILANWSESQGWFHGVPVPSLSGTSAQLMIAKGAPYDKAFLPGNLKESVKTCSDTDIDDEIKYLTVHKIEGRDVMSGIDKHGSFKISQSHSQARLKLLIQSTVTRVGAVTATAEFKAMLKLLCRLNDAQRDSYILSGSFIESGKSRTKYILRKGLPTIALSVSDPENSKFLAALCLHPLAYYSGTFVGSLPPSDDVLSHLLLIRSDEHYLWRKSVQHSLDDPRSGV